MKGSITKLIVATMAIPLLAVAILTSTTRRVYSAPLDAAADFKAKCAACHGADGKGATATGKALKLRDLGSAEVQAQSDDELLNIISKGKGKMPAYEKGLGADSCRALVAHIRTLKP